MESHTISTSTNRSKIDPIVNTATEADPVELKLFNDCALIRDLKRLCAKVIQEQPRLPDGRRLLFKVQGTSLPTLDAQERAVA